MHRDGPCSARTGRGVIHVATSGSVAKGPLVVRAHPMPDQAWRTAPPPPQVTSVRMLDARSRESSPSATRFIFETTALRPPEFERQASPRIIDGFPRQPLRVLEGVDTSPLRFQAVREASPVQAMRQEGMVGRVAVAGRISELDSGSSRATSPYLVSRNPPFAFTPAAAPFAWSQGRDVRVGSSLQVTSQPSSPRMISQASPRITNLPSPRIQLGACGELRPPEGVPSSTGDHRLSSCPSNVRLEGISSVSSVTFRNAESPAPRILQPAKTWGAIHRSSSVERMASALPTSQSYDSRRTQGVITASGRAAASLHAPPPSLRPRQELTSASQPWRLESAGGSTPTGSLGAPPSGLGDSRPSQAPARSRTGPDAAAGSLLQNCSSQESVLQMSRRYRRWSARERAAQAVSPGGSLLAGNDADDFSQTCKRLQQKLGSLAKEVTSSTTL